MTLAWKVALGLTGLAVTTYAVSEVVRRARAKIPTGPTPSPPTPKRPTRDYVGSGWTAWPHKDVFPDVDAIVQALRRLGYAPDDSLLTANSMQQVGAFQSDHNVWWVAWNKLAPDGPYPETPASPGKAIAEDDLVGHDTVEALYDALLADQHFPGGWQEMLNWYAGMV